MLLSYNICFTPQSSSYRDRGGGDLSLSRYSPLSVNTTCFERVLGPVPRAYESPWNLEKTTPHPVKDQSVPDHERQNGLSQPRLVSLEQTLESSSYAVELL